MRHLKKRIKYLKNELFFAGVYIYIKLVDLKNKQGSAVCINLSLS